MLWPAVVLIFLLSVGLGIAFFPGRYEFPVRWVSALASPRLNPDGHVVFGAGLSLMALLLAPMPGFLASRLKGPGTAAAVGLLWVGIAGLFLLGLEAACSLRLASGLAHRIFTTMIFLGLTPGLLYFTARAFRPGCGWPAGLGCAVLTGPVLGAGATRLFLDLGPGPVDRHAISPVLTLAFWEWAAVAGLVAGGYLTTWAASRAAARDLVPGSRAPAGPEVTGELAARRP